MVRYVRTRTSSSNTSTSNTNINSNSQSPVSTSQNSSISLTTAGFIMGRGERAIREDDVKYHGGALRYGTPMGGRLILTSKRFAFIETDFELVGGIFGIGAREEIRTKGIKINIPTENLIGAQTENRTRRIGTLNEPPGIFSKETYTLLIVSMETDNGVENTFFEVGDAHGWANAIQSQGHESM